MNLQLVPDDEVKNAVRELLATNKTVYLSTTANDRPFLALAYFAESDPFHLTLIVESAGRSLANVAVNPNIAVMISTGSPFDLYVEGEGSAEVLSDQQQVLAAVNAVRAKAPEIELLKMNPVALNVTIRHWQATDVSVGWRVSNELIPPAERSPN